MAAVPFHRLHGLERAGGTLDEFAGADIAEIVCRQVGKQGQAHVGG